MKKLLSLLLVACVFFSAILPVAADGFLTKAHSADNASLSNGHDARDCADDHDHDDLAYDHDHDDLAYDHEDDDLACNHDHDDFDLDHDCDIESDDEELLSELDIDKELFEELFDERNVASANVSFDTDPAGGYKGDYVIIYNPSTNPSQGMTTGNMKNKIKTNAGISISSINGEAERGADSEKQSYIIDVDAELKELAAEMGYSGKPEFDGAGAAVSFNVGDQHTFKINKTYSPLSSNSIKFKVLYKGSHCYIWTPVSSNSNVYPLDKLGSGLAKKAAQEFDSKFDKMKSSFGSHSNGTQGDGRVHILYYNIDDGWTPGNGYTSGFFWSVDLHENGLPIINIDTYPTVFYGSSTNITKSYPVLMHEYQHLINYSECGSTPTWLDEAMSAAAEEICYPGSAICSYIENWLNYSFGAKKDWLNPPIEHKYTSSYSLHKGFSMYKWDDSLPTADLLALYAQVALFSQYIYTQFGNATFRKLLVRIAEGDTVPDAIKKVTGKPAATVVRNFRIALTANTSQSISNGTYGFKMQSGYDPAQYHDVTNLYSLLSPVVFTGSKCTIYGGGAITVKPVNNVYNPPSDANSSLKYIGVTRHYYKYKKTDANKHSVTCLVCGQQKTENHSFTYTSIGIGKHKKYCTKCSYYTTEGHTRYFEQYNSQDHREYCSNCNYSSVQNHSFAAYQYTQRQHKLVCRDCGYTKFASHSFAAYQYTQRQHKLVCRDCGYTKFASHSFNTNGVCITCGYTGGPMLNALPVDSIREYALLPESDSKE